MSGITNIKQYKRNIRIALIYAAGTLRLNKEKANHAGFEAGELGEKFVLNGKIV